MPATPDYDVVKIRDFMTRHVDLHDFCFVLSHRLGERYAYRLLRGETPQEKGAALLETAEQQEELGEVIFHLAKYWLEDCKGKPGVLVGDGIAEQLALYGQALAAAGDTDRRQLVEALLSKLPGRGASTWPPMPFVHGYAVLIGAGAFVNPSIPALSATVNDAKALAGVLQAPQHCAYPPEQVHLVTGPGATRQAILSSLDWLAHKAAQDRMSTALFYFSGHGWRDLRASGDRYYLLPYDGDLLQPDATALDDDLLTYKLAAIQSERVVIILDACYAGGMAKDAAGSPAFTSAVAPPAGLLSRLGSGRGRVVISSSQEDERSYVLAGGGGSVFTQCLVDALSGAASGSRPAEIGVLDLFTYLDREVPLRAAPREQHPVLDGEKTQNFAIARRFAR